MNERERQQRRSGIVCESAKRIVRMAKDRVRKMAETMEKSGRRMNNCLE